MKISLRQIKCLLNRIQRFCKETIITKCEGLNENEYFKQIPVIYIIISYIIPQLIIGKEKINRLLKELNTIMKYGNENELIEFMKSNVEFKKSKQYTFITKGKIFLQLD